MRTETYRTPDGALTLLVQYDSDGIAIGFDGFAWHTHAEIIAELRHETDEEQALRHYLDDLFNDRLRIVVLKNNGTVQDVWIPDLQDGPDSTKYLEPEESLESRCWGGKG